MKPKIQLRDFIIINICCSIVVWITLIGMLLQKRGIIPGMPCIIHSVLHIYCPGCGGTRAVLALLQGQFLESLVYNPAVLLGILLVLYYETGAIITLVKKNGKCYFDYKCRVVYAYLIMIVLFFIIRNWLLLFCGIDMLGDFA